jgi:hypothetical protein
MTPSTTVVPSDRTPRTRTGTSVSPPRSQSAGSVSATHVMSEVAFAVYATSMPLGIQRRVGGMVASASAPIAASRPLQIAMTWTVPRWFCTRRRLRTVSTARFGSRLTKRGRAERK